MNKSDVAYLVTETYTQDDFGIYQTRRELRKVYVNVSSVYANEWFEGGRNGLNPQYRFTMFSFDYLGEKIIEYDGTQYAIYRTFIKNRDEIELYAELKMGSGS